MSRYLLAGFALASTLFTHACRKEYSNETRIDRIRKQYNDLKIKKDSLFFTLRDNSIDTLVEQRVAGPESVMVGRKIDTEPSQPNALLNESFDRMLSPTNSDSLVAVMGNDVNKTFILAAGGDTTILSPAPATLYHMDTPTLSPDSSNRFRAVNQRFAPLNERMNVAFKLVRH